ncbi:hypothetical protein BpHYR1_019848 [Brachionus plicatilis]|uniref:Uncharacterized protein n=1 Tax=Brachionus plicatilis TaxID=10195 RepID=A0A3M7QP80_BRAPC|nr:hypothetical protein BpHYR1_019848 [Brachionus plicatilis]
MSWKSNFIQFSMIRTEATNDFLISRRTIIQSINNKWHNIKGSLNEFFANRTSFSTSLFSIGAEQRKNLFFQKQLLDMSCQWKNKIISSAFLSIY